MKNKLVTPKLFKGLFLLGLISTLSLTSAYAQSSLSSFTLINADTDTDIRILSDGDTINLLSLPTTALNIRANTAPSQVSKVIFDLNGTLNYSVEGSAPYALQGDRNGDFNAWTPSAGQHTLTGTPYHGAKGGLAGTPLSISFYVMTQSVVDCNNDLNGTAFIDNCSICAGGKTGIIPNSVCLDCNGDPNGSAIIDNCGVCAGGNTGKVPNSSCNGCVPNQVVSLTIMQAGAGLAPIRQLVNGDVLYKDQLGPFGVSADICNNANIGSVIFSINGNVIRTENRAPYAINGDNASGFRAWNVPAGNYTLTALPFSGANATGTAGIAKTVSFTIVDIAPSVDCNGDFKGSASIDACGVCSGGNTGLVPNATCLDCNNVPNGSAVIDDCGDCVQGNTNLSFNGGCNIDCAGVVNGTATIDNCGVCSGGTSGLTANASCADCNGDPNGTASIDACAVCSGGNTGIVPNSSCGNCVPNEVVSLMLIDASSNQDLAGMADGDTIDLRSLPKFSVRAEVCSDPAVESVEFVLNGNTIRKENIAPYSVNGDNNGNYTPWNIAAGSYTLSVTPFSGNSASGTAGVPKVVRFWVIAGPPPPPVTDCNGIVGGSAFTDACGNCVGGNTGLNPCTPIAGCDEFIEVNGLVVVEIESEPKANGSWYQGSGTINGLNPTGVSGSYYMWQPNCVSGSAPNYIYSSCGGTTGGNDANAMTYEVYISNPGRYRFRMRSWQPNKKIGNHSASTDNNDFWLQLPDGGGIKKKNNTEIAIGKSEWVKIYQNSPANWVWGSKTIDNNPHNVFVDFPTAGTYRIKIGARSKLMALDRFVLYRSGNPNNNVTDATATTGMPPESQRGPCLSTANSNTGSGTNGQAGLKGAITSGSAESSAQLGQDYFNAAELSLDAYPNPTTGTLQLAIQPAGAKAFIELYDATGKLLISDTQEGEGPSLDLSSFPKGIYMLKISVGGQLKVARIYKD